MMMPADRHRHARRTGIGSLLLLLAAAGPSSAAALTGPRCGVHAEADEASILLPSAVDQGCPVFGRVPVGSQVRIGERPLRVGALGELVFGVGRDQRDSIELTIAAPGAEPRTVSIAVRPRDWPTERVDGVPPATVEPPPEIAARIAREQAAVAATRVRDDARSDFALGFGWPLQGRISGVFGSQRIYNGIPRSPHSGLDVAAPAGTPLRAPAAGIVVFADPDLYLTGGTVLIDHGHGLSSAFLHLSRIDVEVGDRVARGQVFGTVGATGRATGPHMHWGLNWFDSRLDPAGLPGIATATVAP